MSENVKAWLAFGCVAFFWGTTYLAIKVGVESMPPLLFAGLRHFTAGAIILTYFFIKKYPVPSREQLKHALVMSLMMLTIGNGLLVYAEKYITSGLSAIISSTFPFAVFFFSWVAGHEKATKYVIGGIVLGFLGQLLIFSDNLEDLQNPDYRWGIVALFVAVVVWGYGAVYRKKAVITLNPLQFAGWQMVIAGGFLLPLSAIRGEFLQLHTVTTDGIWALAYLVVFGSIVAYGSFMYVLDKLPATVVSMYSHINTIVAVLLGWLFLNEALTWEIALSTVFTLLGVWLVSISNKKEKSRT